MRKLLLLSLALFSFYSASAQVTLFKENFDAPSGPDSVTTGRTLFNPSQPPATRLWNDTNFLSTSPNTSYHVQGTQYNDIWFNTDTFSTVGLPYVFLTFNHIAKLYEANVARIEISTNGGVNWSIIDDYHYRGTSNLFPATNFFNEAAYMNNNDLWENLMDNTVPKQSWWVTERFDLRGMAYDTVANTGYPYVMIRFLAKFNLLNPNLTPPSFHAGWFVDDVEVIGSTCELDPPQVSFTGNGVCIEKPEGAVVQDVSNSYTVSVNATDKGAGMDFVELHYTHNGVLDTILMANPSGSKYTATIPNIPLGDTVYYHVEAYDKSCPNITKLPSAFVGDIMFYVDSGYPAKCGSTYCLALPNTIKVDNLPWVETFDGLKWGAQNVGTNGPRGVFPVYPTDWWVVAPPNSSANNNKYAWSIANGPTATNLTGPSSNHTPGGSKYLYTEGSFTSPIPNTNISNTSIFTPCIDLTKNTKCLGFEFYYHMFGADMGSQAVLRVDIDTASGNEPLDLYTNYLKIEGEQQSSSTSPWKRAVFDLTPFNGQLIRVRFSAFKFGSGEKYDIAIDDLKIFEPEAVDVELTEYIGPKNGYCNYTNNETITVRIRNNGCTPLNIVPIKFRDNQGAVISSSVNLNGMVMGGDTVINIPTGANLSALGMHQLTIWSDLAGDNKNDNDTLVGVQIEHTAPITSFPFFEDFEGGTKGSQNLGNTNFRFDTGLNPGYKWQVGEGLTPTRGTGPSQGYYYGGKYLYTEWAGSGSAPNETYFRTLCLDLSGMSDPTLDFFYHKFAPDASTLDLQVSLANQHSEQWSNVAGSTVSASNTEEISEWHFKRVNLKPYAGQTIKLRFRAIRSGGADLTDLAIDNISIYDRKATDGGAAYITSPGLGVPVGAVPSFKPTITVTNYGLSNLTNPTIKVEITPKCGTNPVTATYTETVSGSIPTGASQNFTLNNTNINWPTGAFEMKVYTDVNNDFYSFNDTVKRNVIGIPTHMIPFDDNFDDCGFSRTGFVPARPQPVSLPTLYQWELGQPQNTGGSIRNPQSSPNAWVTNLDGPYLPGTEEWLLAPIFRGFDTLVGTEYRFYQNMDFAPASGSTGSAGVVEYLAAGNEWKPLGGDFINSGIGVNWYGSKYGTQASTVLSGPAWEGTTNGGWIASRFPLFNFDATPGILRSRFRFKSNESVTKANNRGGWGIDDFELYVPGQHSAEPIAVRTKAAIPFPGFDQDILVTIFNSGARRLNNVKIEVIIEGISLDGTPDSVSDVYITSNLRRGAKERLEFNFKWPGNQVTPGVHNVTVITYRPNGFKDSYPAGDTLNTATMPEFYKYRIIVPDEIDMRAGANTEHCDDFEGTQGQIPWFTRSSEFIDGVEEFNPDSTSWEQGAPSQFDSAYSGTRVWTTFLDSNYMNLERSSLFSPVYLIDSGTVYTIDFFHNYNTEDYHDGGNMEVSFDGGISWSKVGYFNPFRDWYDTEFVTSLDIINPGWAGNSKGWVNSNWKVMFGSTTKAVFRFKFASDAEIRRPGWAIDNFCFLKDTTNGSYDQFIGEDEQEILPEGIIATDLSPNPTRDIANLGIYLPSPATAEMVVVNNIGQPVERRTLKLNNGINKIEVDGSNWKPGMYIIQLQLGDEWISRKLIVQ